MEETVQLEQKSQTQTRKRRVGMEQVRDAVKDIEDTVMRLSETNNRILKNKLDALQALVGKHCAQPVVAPSLKKSSVGTQATNKSMVPKPTMLSPIPEEESPKMTSKARVIDQTFNKFRSEISDSLKSMGAPLTTQGNKTISSIWKSAKAGKEGEVKESLKGLGVPEEKLAPMAAKAVEEAKSYLARAETRKVKATPMKTPGKTRKVSMRKKSLVVPPLSAEVGTSPEEATTKKEVEFEGKKYYVMPNMAVFEKKDDDSIGESMGTWDEVEQKIISL